MGGLEGDSGAIPPLIIQPWISRVRVGSNWPAFQGLSVGNPFACFSGPLGGEPLAWFSGFLGGEPLACVSGPLFPGWLIQRPWKHANLQGSIIWEASTAPLIIQHWTPGCLERDSGADPAPNNSTLDPQGAGGEPLPCFSEPLLSPVSRVDDSAILANTPIYKVELFGRPRGRCPSP